MGLRISSYLILWLKNKSAPAVIFKRGYYGWGLFICRELTTKDKQAVSYFAKKCFFNGRSTEITPAPQTTLINIINPHNWWS